MRDDQERIDRLAADMGLTHEDLAHAHAIKQHLANPITMLVLLPHDQRCRILEFLQNSYPSRVSATDCLWQKCLETQIAALQEFFADMDVMS